MRTANSPVGTDAKRRAYSAAFSTARAGGAGSFKHACMQAANRAAFSPHAGQVYFVLLAAFFFRASASPHNSPLSGARWPMHSSGNPNGPFAPIGVAAVTTNISR